MKNKLIVLLAFTINLMAANFSALYGQQFWDDPQIFEKKSFEEIVKETEAYYTTNFEENERRPGYKQFMRWQISAGMRLGENRKLINSNAKVQQEYSKFLKTNKKADSRFNSGHWIEEGHFGYDQAQSTVAGQGRVNCIAFHPNNPNTIFVGTANGGLWKTNNDGVTWMPLTDGLPSIGVSGITIDPNDPNRIWILTGDGDAKHSWSIGVLYSENGGLTWEKTGFEFGLGEIQYGYDLVANPENVNTQYALMKDGIHKTEDGWKTSNIVHPFRSYDLAIKPGDTSTVYTISQNNFYVSNNGGAFFNQVDGNGVLPLPFTFSRGEVETTPANPEAVYLFYGGGTTGFPGVFKSEDSGVNWDLMDNDLNVCSRSKPFQDSVHQAWYDHALAVDPNNEDILFTGGVNVFKSDEGGNNFDISGYWVNSDEGYPIVHADIHDLAFNNGSLYVGCDGGVFKTADGGQTYQDISAGLRISQYYFIDVAPNQIIGGMQDNGSVELNYLVSNQANHKLGGDGFACLFNYDDPSIYYLSTQNNRYKYEDGVYQGEITQDIPDTVWQQDFIMDPENPNILFTTKNEVYRSNNAGDDWIELDAFDDAQNARVSAMIQGISNRNRLYIAKSNLVVRTDSALIDNPIFIDISAGLPNLKVQDMAVNPQNSTEVYAVLDGFVPGEKVYRKNGLNGNWDNLSGNLPNVPVYSIVYHEGSADGIFIGTEIGVFYIDNNLPDWQYYGNNLPTVSVYDLKILPGVEKDKLFAGTFGRGIWSAEIESMACTLTHNLTEENNPGDSAFDGIKVYEADQSITSTRQLDGGLGTNVLYSAGSFIQLNQGFRANHKSIFTAVLDGCTGVTIPSMQNENTSDQKD